MEYGSFDELKGHLVNKRIVKWTDNSITLDDGTLIEIEMSESDCCASASGTFSNVELDAMITDVTNVEIIKVEDDEDYRESEGTLYIFSNMNIVAQVDLIADGGNGGYYYSVVSAKIKGIYYPLMNDGGDDLTMTEV